MEFNDIKSRMQKVGNYIKESTSKSLDALKSDRRLSTLQDEINDAYRMLGYLLYTEMKTEQFEHFDKNRQFDKSGDIISMIDDKCEEIEKVKGEIAAEAEEKNAGAGTPVFCAHCGAELSEKDRFCSKCGKPVL